MFVTLVLLVLILYLVLVARNMKKQLPGPFPWPFIGNHFLLKNLTRELGAHHLAFTELSKRYKSHLISLGSGSNKVIVVSGIKYVDHILKNEVFDGRPWNGFIEMRNLGKKQGITMNDGEDWKELRVWTVRTLRSLGFGRQEMMDMIKNELTMVLEKLKTGSVQRLKPLLGPVVINVIWMLSTGKPFADNQKLKYFTGLMERRAEAFDISGGLIAAFPWIRYIAPEISGYNLITAMNNELKDFLMEIIAEHKKRYVPENNNDLIDMFLHEMYKENNSSSIFTEDQLMMVLIDMFIAGCTTTSTTLDFLFLNMLVHQDVQRKVQQELDSVIPSDRLPDLNDRINLPYTEAVISESQRMWSVFPIIGPRRVLRDTVIDDYKIPKESTILINIYSANMDPEVFEDPHTFKPERFLKDGAYEPIQSTVIFGKGKRRCPGEALARSAMFILFTGILQKYSILPVPGKAPTSIDIVSGLAISPKPYEILVVKR